MSFAAVARRPADRLRRVGRRRVPACGCGRWPRPTAQPLAGTEGATFPFWSPDSRSIGFFADGNAEAARPRRRGAPQTLAPVSIGLGGTWSADGVILFATDRNWAPCCVCPPGAATSSPVTTLGAGSGSHRFPQFLPDGRQFLFYAAGTAETAGIYLGALDATAVTRVTAADIAGAFLPTGPGSTEARREGGWLLFGRQGTLVARRFDAARGILRGDTGDRGRRAGHRRRPVRGRLGLGDGPGGLPGRWRRQRQLTWFDRAGQALGTRGRPGRHAGRSRAVARRPPGRGGAHGAGQPRPLAVDGARTTPLHLRSRPQTCSRVVARRQPDRVPPAGPGGRPRSLPEAHERGRRGGAAAGLAGDEGADELVGGRPVAAVYSLRPHDAATSGWCRWPAIQSRLAFLNTTFHEGNGAFSPDGRWVAYGSNESGRREIYVRPFPAPARRAVAGVDGGRHQTRGGGPTARSCTTSPPTAALMAAPIASSGTTLQPGLPTRPLPTAIALGGGAAQRSGDPAAIRRGAGRPLPDQHVNWTRAPPRRSRCSRTGIPRRRSSVAPDRSP